MNRLVSTHPMPSRPPRLVAELHALPAESAKREHLSSVALAKDVAINLSAGALAKVEANLPARHSAQREGGRGLGYGG